MPTRMRRSLRALTPPVADLQSNDLVPYRTLTTQAPVGVMVGHMP